MMATPQNESGCPLHKGIVADICQLRKDYAQLHDDLTHVKWLLLFLVGESALKLLGMG